MAYNPLIHHRRSIRLQGYDYAQEGMYYVTLCVRDRVPVFGEIVGTAMQLSRIGKIAEDCWKQIPDHFSRAVLDDYVIMPDHMHGILILKEIKLVGAQYIEPRREKLNRFQHVVPGSISSIIRSYKAAVTRLCGQAGLKRFHWQRDYYEHIIRDGDDLDRIREYIACNPDEWAERNDLQMSE